MRGGRWLLRRGVRRLRAPSLSPHPPTPTRVRTPADVLKWFGCELGALTNFDKKSGTSIVNGAHDAGRLSQLLEGFIKK